jgi:hypothetical protein
MDIAQKVVELQAECLRILGPPESWNACSRGQRRFEISQKSSRRSNKTSLSTWQSCTGGTFGTPKVWNTHVYYEIGGSH